MKRDLLYLGICLFCCLMACRPESGDSTAATVASPTDTTAIPLSFKDTTFIKTYGQCQDSVMSDNCVNIKLAYPYAIGTANSELINETVQSALASILYYGDAETAKSLSLAQLADTIIAEYQIMKAEMGDNAMEYAFEVNGKILLHNDSIVSLELPAYTFTGGAHPNSYNTLLTFDLKQQKVLEQNNLVADTTALKQIGETAFFAARGPEEPKSQFFWDGDYFLPANMALTKEGLYFYYNPYEAAAYVFGPTEYTIPYDQLKGIIRPEYLPK